MEINFKNYINPFSNLLAFKILHITQQAAIYLLKESFGGCAVLESDAVSDFLSETYVHFLRHTLGDGHGRHSPGLGTGHTLLLIPTPHPLQTPLGNLHISKVTLAMQKDRQEKSSIKIEELKHGVD